MGGMGSGGRGTIRGLGGGSSIEGCELSPVAAESAELEVSARRGAQKRAGVRRWYRQFPLLLDLESVD